MRFVILFHQMSYGDVRVALSRRKALVAQQFLNGSQISPEFNMCVAKEWRMPCGLMLRPKPLRKTYLSTSLPTERVVSRVPRWFRNTGPDGCREPACASRASR